MTLPVPDLDDRRAQDLVDDAKRLVQKMCPEWTDHNVSDPGVTLIEAFAYMVDQLIYRLNRVPDRMYVKFLELVGVRLFAPHAATADVTFWLSAGETPSTTVKRGTEVSTLRTETEDAVGFVTLEDFEIPTCELMEVATQVTQGTVRGRMGLLRSNQGFNCFDDVPKPGDALYLGLSAAVPSCALLLHVDARVEGVGVRPGDVPLAWEAWDATGWAPCPVEYDDTRGLNVEGNIIIHVHRHHTMSVVSGLSAGWIRCRVVEPVEDQLPFLRSPFIRLISADTIGGTTKVTNAMEITNEILGVSEGVPGQRFNVLRYPVVGEVEADAELEVSDGTGWEPWHEVTTFSASDGEDRHFTLDRITGGVDFGPAVRLSDGTLRAYGAVPKKGAYVRMKSYRTGGGRRGNVDKGKISVLKTSIPYVARVENRLPARGGVDGETIEEAKLRGPVEIRTRNRAVAAVDFELLARQAAPAVARVKCVPGTEEDGPGAVRLLVVPARGVDATGPLRFEELVPPAQDLAKIASYLDERRVIGTRIQVLAPYYQGLTVVARMRAVPAADPGALAESALAALYRYFDPIGGGPNGGGWPFGRAVHIGEVYSVLQRLPGTEMVEEALLFTADPIERTRGRQVDRLELDGRSLVFSYDHRVRVTTG